MYRPIDEKTKKIRKETTHTHTTYYRRRQEEAREEAIEWQHDFCNHNYSYMELAEWGDYFTKLAKKYGLIREFKNEGIIWNSSWLYIDLWYYICKEMLERVKMIKKKIKIFDEGNMSNNYLFGENELWKEYIYPRNENLNFDDVIKIIGNRNYDENYCSTYDNIYEFYNNFDYDWGDLEFYESKKAGIMEAQKHYSFILDDEDDFDYIYKVASKHPKNDNEEAEIIEELISLCYKQEWENTIINGFMQADWVEIWYRKDEISYETIRDLQAIYFGDIFDYEVESDEVGYVDFGYNYNTPLYDSSKKAWYNYFRKEGVINPDEKIEEVKIEIVAKREYRPIFKELK